MTGLEKNSICIQDIAHALSNICRFTGHTKKFYSVAQHSVLASRYAPTEHKLTALLHDATESYINDLSTPAKSILPSYCYLEDEIYKKLIAKTFKLPLEIPKEVKEIDLKLLMTEKRDLLKTTNIEWSKFFNNIEPYEKKIRPWGHRKSENMFLKTFYQICFKKS
jgi:hypothetical protein